MTFTLRLEDKEHIEWLNIAEAKNIQLAPLIRSVMNRYSAYYKENENKYLTQEYEELKQTIVTLLEQIENASKQLYLIKENISKIDTLR